LIAEQINDATGNPAVERLGDVKNRRDDHAHILPVIHDGNQRAGRRPGPLRLSPVEERMKNRTSFADVRRRARLAGQVFHNVAHNLRYVVNDDYYWDRYVKNWEDSESAQRLEVLGAEWGNEEVFLSMLERLGSSDQLALEIGSGGGRITKRGVEIFRHVHAGDPSREMLRRLRESVPAENLSLHRLDGFTLEPFEDSSLDFVYSHDVFVHFSSLQVFPYLLEIRRVLKPQGVGLISFYNFVDDFAEFREMAVQFWDQRRYPPHMRIHFLTEEMIRRMLDDLGLELVEADVQNFMIVAFRKPA
jgi:SAM-dependent methyltransferase